jgi:hypothetical protein
MPWQTGNSMHSCRLPGQMPGYIHRPLQIPGDYRRRDRVRLMVPTADRVIEVVVALQRHAAPAGLVIQYMITHDDPWQPRIESLTDTTEKNPEQLERVLE